MKKIVIIIVVLTTNLACKSNKTSQVNESITWIKTLKTQFKANVTSQQQIIHYRYNKQDVYLVDACYQCPDYMSYLYDKEKNVLCTFGGITGKNTCPDFYKKAILIGYEYNDVKPNE